MYIYWNNYTSTMHCTLYIVYPVYSVQCTLYSELCTLYNVQCIVYAVHCTVYTIHCTVYNMPVTIILYRFFITGFSCCDNIIWQCTLYTVYSVHNVQYTAYILWFTVYSVQCTLYTAHCIWHNMQDSNICKTQIYTFYDVWCIP